MKKMDKKPAGEDSANQQGETEFVEATVPVKGASVEFVSAPA